MAKYKPKSASTVYSEARIILLAEPWLTYSEVHAEMTAKCSASTIQVYGSSIRHEIGCRLKSVNNKEQLHIDYAQYTAACAKYMVNAQTAAALVEKSTPARKIEVKEQASPPEAVVPAANDLLDRLSVSFEAAELRSSLAVHEIIHLEVKRKMLMEQVSGIDSQIATYRKTIDEASEAMEVLLKLRDAPESVLRMVLGES